jgi:hypothetical protein
MLLNKQLLHNGVVDRRDRFSITLVKFGLGNAYRGRIPTYSQRQLMNVNNHSERQIMNANIQNIQNSVSLKRSNSYITKNFIPGAIYQRTTPVKCSNSCIQQNTFCSQGSHLVTKQRLPITLPCAYTTHDCRRRCTSLKCKG